RRPAYPLADCEGGMGGPKDPAAVAVRSGENARADRKSRRGDADRAPHGEASVGAAALPVLPHREARGSTGRKVAACIKHERDGVAWRNTRMSRRAMSCQRPTMAPGSRRA